MQNWKPSKIPQSHRTDSCMLLGEFKPYDFWQFTYYLQLFPTLSQTLSNGQQSYSLWSIEQYQPWAKCTSDPHLNFKASWYNTGDETQLRISCSALCQGLSCGIGLLSVSCSWSWQSRQDQAGIQTHSPSLWLTDYLINRTHEMELPWNLMLAEGFWALGQPWGDLVSVQFSHQHARDDRERALRGQWWVGSHFDPDSLVMKNSEPLARIWRCTWEELGSFISLPTVTNLPFLAFHYGLGLLRRAGWAWLVSSTNQ